MATSAAEASIRLTSRKRALDAVAAVGSRSGSSDSDVAVVPSRTFRTRGTSDEGGSSSKTEVVYVPTLSAQELIDCDVQFNRGCYGGNHVFGLQYIQQFGLTTSTSYPFAEKKQRCALVGGGNSGDEGGNVDSTKYYIDNSTPIDANDQVLMQQALLHFGPISIGVCGTALSFLYYSSGVYNDWNCCSSASGAEIGLNHAMLLVGYGRDEDLEVDYWIALNRCVHCVHDV